MRTEAKLFKALADETRLKILWLLMEQKELCVPEFTGVLDITQSRASRHLHSLPCGPGDGQAGPFLRVSLYLSWSRDSGRKAAGVAAGDAGGSARRRSPA
jgi:DNA-binding transcriptional ArsR family regulator